MKIAIVGSGVSGLTCAHLLHRGHDVTLFEANDYVGGHTNTIDVELDGRNYAIDTGFIVYNETNYPNFTRLLSQLGVASQPTSMSFSVRCDRTGLEYNGTSLNTLFAQRRNLIRLRFWKMLADIMRFGREAPKLLLGGDDRVTVSDYVTMQRYSDAFVGDYLVPLGASLWSCPTETFRQFPMRFVVEFLANHAMLQWSGRPEWRVVRGGSKQYIEPLTRPFRDRIRLRCPIKRVRRFGDHVALQTQHDGELRFDHVILACHADTSLRLLGDDATHTERDLLGAFPYQPNEAVLHTDTSVLPRRRRAWASWNYRVNERLPDRVTVTYNMNELQSLSGDRTFCVTLNDDGRIDPGRIIRRIRYQHPVFTTRRDAAQKRHGEVIDRYRTSFCGAYWGYGFHEDGVNSGLAVCRALGERWPA